MANIIIKDSVISGIHITKIGSHESIALNIEDDNSIQHIDPNCLKVMFPAEVSDALLKEITYPKNPANKRFKDQLVEDCLGKKVGNVPANLCGLFRKLVSEHYVCNIKCFSTGLKPRPSRRPPTQQTFRRNRSGGSDRQGGGLILDCKYVLTIINTADRAMIVKRLRDLIEENDLDATVV